VSSFLQVRSIGSDSRWLTIAEVEDDELAEAMAHLVYHGIVGNPGGVAVGRTKRRPALDDAAMTPAEVQEAEHDLASLDEQNAAFAAALQAAAAAQLAG